MRILANLNVVGTLDLDSVANAGVDTDRFLVQDANGVVRYRTGAEVASDIGSANLAASVLKHQVKLGEAIAKGQAVYVSSSDGTNMIVSKASNTSESTSSKTLGLLETGGALNAQVNVITEGLLAGLDTSTANAGDPVWLGTNGNLIFGLPNKPYAPAHLVFIGIVTRVQQINGEIFIKPQNGFELKEIHDVQITTTPADNTVLSYENSSSLYKMKSIATLLGYTPANAARNITINGTTYDLTADRTWNVGTVTSIGVSVPTGLAVSNTPITGAGTIAISLAAGYSIPTTASQSNWDTAYGWGNHASAGYQVTSQKGQANGYASLDGGGKVPSTQLPSYVDDVLEYANLAGFPGTGETGKIYVALDNNKIYRWSGTAYIEISPTVGTVWGTITGTLSNQTDLQSALDAKVPTSRTITINGTALDLSANRSWTVGDVRTDGSYANPAWITSLAWSKITGAPAFLTAEADTLATVTGRGNTTSTYISVDYVIATNNGNGTNYRVGDDAWFGDVNLANTVRLMGIQNNANGYIIFGNGDNTALGRAGTGALTYGGNTVYHSGNLTNLNQLTNGPGYITGNQTITLSGDATGSGTTSIGVTLANSGVTTGTYTKVTVDAKGRVTSGTTLSAGDIPTLNYVAKSGDSMTGNLSFGSSGAGITWAANTDGASITFESTGDGASGGRALSNLLIALSDNGDEGLKVTSAGTELFYVNTNQIQYKGNTVWHSANDGAGSGLDADLLDGISSASFLRSDVVGATVTGTILSNNNANVDGPNFNVDTTNKTVNEYAYKVSRSGSAVGGILIDGRGAFASGTTVNGSTVWHQGNLTNLNQLSNGPGYITGNQTITLTGHVTGSGTTSIATTIANGVVTNAMLVNSSFYIGTTSISLGRASAGQTLSGVSIDGYAGYLNNTNQGKTGNQSLVTVSSTTDWSNYPIGYSAMFSSGQTATGTPSSNYGYFIKVANRDAGGGWGGIWMDYSNGDMYQGTTTVSSSYATWRKIWDSSNLTNLNQLTNGPGYITSYTETDTLATVTSRGASTSTALSLNGGVTITGPNAWNAATPMLNIGGSGDGRMQVRHIWGKSSNSSGTDHLWLQYSNTGNHVQIGDSGGGNNLYVSGNIYMNGYFSGNLVATQSWVQSQGYLTSVSDVWVNTSGDTMTGSLVIRNTGSFNNIRVYTEDDNSWIEQTKPDGTIVGRMGFDGYSTSNAYYTEYTVSTRSSSDAGLVRRMSVTDGRVLVLENLNGFTYNGNTVWHAGNLTNLSQLTNGPGYITSYTETDTLATVTGRGASTNTFVSLLGGSRIVVQNSTDGGNNRGIFMWNTSDTNWGIYMSTAGASKSLANGTAPTGIDGSNSHHIRFRIAGGSGNGFIWENHSEQTLMSVRGDNGNLYVRGQIYAGNSTTNQVWHSGNLTNLNQLSNGPGYITSSALSSYLPLSGGTLTGTLIITTSTDGALTLRVPSGDANQWNYINFNGTDNVRDAYFGTDGSGNPTWWRDDNSLNVVLGSTFNVNGAGLTLTTADADVRVNRGRFQVYNNAGTGNLGYRIRTDDNGGWRWQFVDGGNNEYFGVAYTSGVVTFGASSGTIASRGGFSDFIGYNASYGSYIGGGVANASNYLYAGGYFYDGSTVRTLWHTGNFNPGSYLPLSGGTMTGDLRFNQGSGFGRIAFLDNYHGMILRGIPNNAAGDVTVGDYTSLIQHSGDFRFYRTNGSINELYFQVNATAAYWRGNTIIHSGTIGSQSVAYASNADTVDGYHMNQNVLTSSSPTFQNVTADGSVAAYGLRFRNGTAITYCGFGGGELNNIFHTESAWGNLRHNDISNYEVSADGSSWSAGTLDANIYNLFLGERDKGGSLTIAASGLGRYQRFTFAIGYKNFDMLHITGSTNGEQIYIKLETSTDGGSTYTENFTSIWSSWPGNHSKVWSIFNSAITRIRLTIYKPGNNYGNSASINSINYYGGYSGYGERYHMQVYSYDYQSASINRNTFIGGSLTVYSNQTIAGSGYGLYFSGGNNRIYFGGNRAIEGNGTNLQIGEGHSQTQIQSATTQVDGNIVMAKGSDPRIYSNTNVGLNIDGQALYLNRYVGSDISMVFGGGNVMIGPYSGPSFALHVKKNQNQVAGFESPNANTWIDLISTAGTWSMGATSSNTWAIYQRGVANATRFEVGPSSASLYGNTVWHAGNLTNLNQLSNGPGYVTSANWSILGTGVSYNTDRTTKVSNGLAIYGAYSGGSNSPTFYDIAAQFVLNSRAMEFSASWHNPSATLYFRTLRDCCDNWSSWVTMLSSANYSSYALALSGGTMSGNLYIQSGANPTQFNLRGTNPELYVDAAYGGGTARLFINRQSTANQATLHFTTGYSVSNGTAWNYTGSPLWSMGMTNSSETSNFKIAYGDIYDANSVAINIDTSKNVNLSADLRFNSSTSRRMYGASLGAGYNAIRCQGEWNNFDIMGRVLDWTGSNLHFGNGYNGESHANYYMVVGNPVSYFKVEGPIYATGDVIAYYSDRRLKQNIQPINSALDIINKIGAYTFEWNKKSEEVWAKKEGDKDFGLISQEVEAVWPMGVAIQGGKDINDKFDYGNPDSEHYDPLHVEKNPDEYKTVRYDKMVTLAIAAIKEQQTLIDNQQKQIEELKEQLKNR